MSDYSSPNPVDTRYVQKLLRFLKSRDPKIAALARKANEDFLRRAHDPAEIRAALRAASPEGMFQRAITPTTVHVPTPLANLSIQYENAEYIGTKILPIVPVTKLSGIFFQYDKRSRLAYPDDTLGARSSPNELNENLTQATYSAQPYGFKEYIDALTLQNQDAPLDEMVDVIANLNEGLAFREELRIAKLLSTSSNYATANTLGSSALYWSAPGLAPGSTGTSNPIGDIQALVASLWQGRGASKTIGFCNTEVWNALTANANLLNLFKYTVPGLAQRQAVANALGLDELLVTSARKDNANEAQAAAYTRIWPNIFGVARVALNPGIRTASLGVTFRVGEKMTNEWFDPSLGPMGGYWGRVSLMETHQIVSNDLGAILTNPIG